MKNDVVIERFRDKCEEISKLNSNRYGKIQSACNPASQKRNLFIINHQNKKIFPEDFFSSPTQSSPPQIENQMLQNKFSLNSAGDYKLKINNKNNKEVKINSNFSLEDKLINKKKPNSASACRKNNLNNTNIIDKSPRGIRKTQSYREILKAIPEEEDEERNKIDQMKNTLNMSRKSSSLRMSKNLRPSSNDMRDSKIISGCEKFNNIKWSNSNKFSVEDDYLIFNTPETNFIVRDKSSESINAEASTSGSYNNFKSTHDKNKKIRKFFNFETVEARSQNSNNNIEIDIEIPCRDDFKQTARFSPSPIINPKENYFINSTTNEEIMKMKNLKLNSPIKPNKDKIKKDANVVTSPSLKLIKTPSIGRIKIASERTIFHSPSISENTNKIPKLIKKLSGHNLNTIQNGSSSIINSLKTITPASEHILVNSKFFSPRNEVQQKSYFNNKAHPFEQTPSGGLPNILPPLSTRKQTQKMQFELTTIFNEAQNFKEDPEVKNKINSLLQNIVEIKNVLQEKSKSRFKISTAPIAITEKKVLNENFLKGKDVTQTFNQFKNKREIVIPKSTFKK